MGQIHKGSIIIEFRYIHGSANGTGHIAVIVEYPGKAGIENNVPGQVLWFWGPARHTAKAFNFYHDGKPPPANL